MQDDRLIETRSISQAAESATVPVSETSPKRVFVNVGDKVRVIKVSSHFRGQTGEVLEIDKPVPRKKNLADIPILTWFYVKMDPPEDPEIGAIWFSEDEISSV